MSKYRKFPNLPWWLVTMDHDTLTDSQKEVLDLTYYCRRYGDCLSHRNAGKQIHRSKITIRRARKRLEQLLLRRSEPAKGSCKVGYAIEYKNEADWRAALRAQKMSLGGRKMSTIFKLSKAIAPLGAIAPSIVTTEPPAAKESSSHPLNPPQGGLGGSWGVALRNHPHWKKILGWERGKGYDDQTAEFHADAKMCKWLKAQEAKEKGLCEKNDGQ